MSESQELNLQDDPRGFVLAIVSAGATFRSLLEAIDHLGESTRGRNRLRLLVDLRAIVPAPGMTEQAVLGEHAGSQLAHAERMASLVAEDERTGYSERVARGLGLNLRVFTSEAEAVDWLTS